MSYQVHVQWAFIKNGEKVTLKKNYSCNELRRHLISSAISPPICLICSCEQISHETAAGSFFNPQKQVSTLSSPYERKEESE